jgi:hypothetical protein
VHCLFGVPSTLSRHSCHWDSCNSHSRSCIWVTTKQAIRDAFVECALVSLHVLSHNGVMVCIIRHAGQKTFFISPDPEVCRTMQDICVNCYVDRIISHGIGWHCMAKHDFSGLCSSLSAVHTGFLKVYFVRWSYRNRHRHIELLADF